jgi:plasmid stabilization system protein ParE
MAQAVEIEWSEDALQDLERFAAFLQEHHPNLAPGVASAIIHRAQVLSEFPRLGRPIGGREEYRQLVLEVLNAPYVFQYRYANDRLVILHVFHGREGYE